MAYINLTGSSMDPAETPELTRIVGDRLKQPLN